MQTISKSIIALLIYSINYASSAEPVNATATATGSSSALSFTATVTPTSNFVGNSSKLYLAVALGGAILFYSDTAGFVPFVGGTEPPPVRAITRNTETISFAGDATAAVGADIYIGYGTNFADMANNARYAKKYTIANGPAPLAVQATSYLNQNSHNIGRIDFSAVQKTPPSGPQGFAIADFFNSGNLDVFTSNWNAIGGTTMTQAQANAIMADPKYYSDLQFWRRGADGKLTLIKEYKNAGCITGRKAAVADFNQDGYPDIALGCHGLDAITGPDGNQIIPGEYSKVMLSDGKGGFTISNIGSANSFAAGISAGDVNGDGYPDIMLPDQFNATWSSFNPPGVSNNVISFLINNKDGTFTKSSGRITLPLGTYFEPNDLIDVDGDGILDAVVGGGEHEGAVPAIHYGDRDGTFGNTRKTVIPAVRDRHTLLQYVLIVDANGKRALYLNRTAQNGSPVGYYNAQTIQKYDLATGASTVVFDSIGPNTGPNHWFVWVLPKMCSDGQMGVVPYSSKSPYMDPTYPDICIH